MSNPLFSRSADCMFESTALSDLTDDLITTSISTPSDQYVWTTTNAWDSINITSALDPTVSAGRLDLKGEGADVVINDVSLTDTLKGIQERLNLLIPNPALESEWNELRELGERYRQLEADLLAKQKMWATLQK
jgi:hypothetical protein